LPDFSSGTMVESFHRSGIAFNLMDWLKRLHKALVSSGPEWMVVREAVRASGTGPTGPLNGLSNLYWAELIRENPDLIQCDGADAARDGWKARGACD